MVLPRILLTNDDGIRRPGLWSLYHALKGLGEVVVVAPEAVRSATGMSLTLHKPLRLKQVVHGGVRAYAVSGTPSDCIILGVNRVLRGVRPDIIVSGINEGENASYQAIYGSGTVAAAVRAAIMGIPAAAFSLTLPESGVVDGGWLKARMDEAASFAAEIVGWILEKGLPEGVDYLNVNFPEKLSSSTPVRITRVFKARYREMVMERRDPKNKPYYWIYGELLPRESFSRDTDVYAVFVEGAISISPMRVDSSTSVGVDLLKDLLESLNRRRPAPG
jgi:5'-nucleotidase